MNLLDVDSLVAHGVPPAAARQIVFAVQSIDQQLRDQAKDLEEAKLLVEHLTRNLDACTEAMAERNLTPREVPLVEPD